MQGWGQPQHQSHHLAAALLQVQCKLLSALILCFIFMCVEVVGGYMAHR